VFGAALAARRQATVSGIIDGSPECRAVF